jgi:hypothetical protein
MTVSNITMSGTDNGLRLKAGRGSGGLVQNVSFSNVTMTNVPNPIYITSYYLNGGNTAPSKPSSDKGQPLTSSTPQWKNITFTGVTATGSSNAGLVEGLPQAPIQNLTFSNVHISASSVMKLWHAHNVVIINSRFSPRPSSIYDVTYAS